MSAVASPLPPNASPSDSEVAGIPNLVRHESVIFEQASTIATGVMKKRHYFRRPGRIVGITSFRRTAASGMGAADSTDVDVNLNGSTILSATIQHENASGNNDKLVAVLKSNHAASDAYGIQVVVGDYLEVEVDAIEAGATGASGLFLDIDVLVG